MIGFGRFFQLVLHKRDFRSKKREERLICRYCLGSYRLVLDSHLINLTNKLIQTLATMYNHGNQLGTPNILECSG